MELKYIDILKKNSELGKSLPASRYGISVLSNIITAHLNEVLEYDLRVDNIPAVVESGEYDNIVQDSFKMNTAQTVIVFWELCNITEGLQYEIETFDDKQIDELYSKIKAEIGLVLKNLQSTSLVLFNKFAAIHFSNATIRENKLEVLAARLNHYLEQDKPTNTRLVELDKVIASVGVERSLDFRYYYSSKALYTIDFYKTYTRYIKPYIMSANGKIKKVLIFDCDNTLWKGILGEDGFDGIEMSPATKDGVIFYEIQRMALALAKQGVLIGLCSKNNPQDVDNVISTHPDMQLRDDDITIKKCNWTDKAVNLKSIAEELNIGLDSLVFIDDASFEINLVKELCPEVTCLQVPENRFDYPGMLRDNSGMFYQLSPSVEDRKKTGMYKQAAQRNAARNKFTDIEGYLSSLELKLTIFRDDATIIPRMAQMTQKTNQFNLTTKRYTEGDIADFVSRADAVVFAYAVSDKYGDSGITGLCIVSIDMDQKVADIDTFLMSCRIIGRNIEYAFMDYLIKALGHIGINKVTSRYVKTEKNGQVRKFYDGCAFALTDTSETTRSYQLDIMKSYREKKMAYIEIKNGS